MKSIKSRSADETMISTLDEIANHLPPFSGPAYLVGGCVRDALLGRRPDDIDVAVAGSPAEWAGRAAAALNARLVPIGKPPQKVYRIVLRNRFLDISGLAKDDITADLLRRDFTINAIGWDIPRRGLVDPAGGRADLAARCIRPVTGQVFTADPVRLIRALRFGAELAFRLAPETLSLMERDGPRLASPAGERLRVELHKLLTTGRAFPFLKLMGETGLMSALLPDVPSPDPVPCGRLEAWFHCPDALGPETARIVQTVSLYQRLALAYAALLDGPGPALGRLEMLARRLRWSRRETAKVQELLRHRPETERYLLKMESHGRSPRTMARLVRSCGGLLPAVALLTLAESGPDLETCEERVETFLADYRQVFAPRLAQPPLITGDDLLRELGLAPSPRLGELLEAVELERLSGTVRTRDEALAQVKRQLEAPPPESGR